MENYLFDLYNNNNFFGQPLHTVRVLKNIVFSRNPYQKVLIEMSLFLSDAVWPSLFQFF